MYRNKPFELVDCSRPAAFVTVARGLIEELLVVQSQQGAVAIRLERHSDKRFTLRRRVLPALNSSTGSEFPGVRPGEREWRLKRTNQESE